MSSSPPSHGDFQNTTQPYISELAIVPDPGVIPSLRQPTRAYHKAAVVRSKNSRVTLAKYRRKHRQYPEQEVIQGIVSTLSTSRLYNSQRKSFNHRMKHGGGTAQAVKQREEALCPADEATTLDTNSCFLCLQSGALQYAVVVKFAWPVRSIAKKVKQKKRSSKASTMVASGISSGGKGFLREGTQAQAMQAIKDAIYRQQGRWKRWLWCYEIRTAEEVNFHFDDISENDRATIKITLLAADTIREAAQTTIDNAPSNVDYEYELACRTSQYHTKDCLIGQDHGVPCIQDRLSEASERLRGYRSQHWLKECLQRPQRAQARQFLEQGLLQRSFVYLREDVVALPVDAEDLARSGELRGVFVTLGWNVNRMIQHVRVGSTYTLFGLAIIWLGSVLWAGQKGDWSTAWAFGQLLAASFALILHHT